jgi:hypothetical protein
MTKYVEFESNDNKIIIGVHGGPQDINDYPNQGVVDDDDPRYLTFLDYVESIMRPAIIENPVDKLKAFLAANPDVAAIL